MKRPAESNRIGEIAERLIALRTALGYPDDQVGFATLVGITPQAWNNYERGRRRPRLDEAMKVRQKTGVPLDWIYYGALAGMPVDIAQKLQTAASKRKRA